MKTPSCTAPPLHGTTSSLTSHTRCLPWRGAALPERLEPERPEPMRLEPEGLGAEVRRGGRRRLHPSPSTRSLAAAAGCREQRKHEAQALRALVSANARRRRGRGRQERRLGHRRPEAEGRCQLADSRGHAGAPAHARAFATSRASVRGGRATVESYNCRVAMIRKPARERDWERRNGPGKWACKTYRHTREHPCWTVRPALAATLLASTAEQAGAAGPLGRPNHNKKGPNREGREVAEGCHKEGMKRP